MAGVDYYALLGIVPTASLVEIQRAFRRLARRLHPDINPGDRAAAAQYYRIQEAFDVLSHPDRRDKYDRHGVHPEFEEPGEPARYGFEGFDFSIQRQTETNTFFEIFRGGSLTGQHDDEPGEDIHHPLSISFAESLDGLKASFQIVRQMSCERCLGWGEIATDHRTRCPACSGNGRSTQARGHMLFAKPCEECRGSGTIARSRCPDCDGAGRFRRSEDVIVPIPAGVSEGARLSFPGLGHHGRGRGKNGNLYIHVHVPPHPLFHRKGDNLYCTLPVTFTEAALGTRMDVPTLEGSVKMRVPAGVQSGQKLRLAGRGAPSLRGDARGDLFVEIRLVTPRVYDDRSRELLRELERLNPMDPRDEDKSVSAKDVSR